MIRRERQGRPRLEVAESEAVSSPSGASKNNFWGVITECDIDSGLAMVDPREGDIGSLETKGKDDVLVYCGVEGWHRVGDEVLCVYNGPGIEPEYTVLDKVQGLGAYEAPSTPTAGIEWSDENEMAEVQDDPDLADYCSDTVELP